MRPAARIKLGYYPCPPRVVQMVASHIIPAPGDTRQAILDPCAGEGIAVMTLRDCLGPERTYVHGVELSTDRAKICQTKPFDAFVRGSSLVGIEWKRHNYDIVWFNPPYDYNKEQGREEIMFFNAVLRDARVLKPGALFIGILLRKQMRNMGKVLLNYLDGFPGNVQQYNTPTVHIFPDPEYDEFEQVVVMGTFRRRARGVVDNNMLEQWITLAESDECPVLDFAAEPVWKPTHYDGTAKPVAPVSMVFDPVAMSDWIAEGNGWLNNPALSDALFARPMERVQTLLGLNSAHLAAAVTGGFVNGEIIDARPEGGDRQMIKGHTIKIRVPVEDRVLQPDGSYRTVENETFSSEVWALNDRGDWHVYRVRSENENKKANLGIQNGVQEGDLLKWMESIEEALRRTVNRLFPPILNKEKLDAIDISQLYNPSRSPAGKQTTLIRALRHQTKNKQPVLVNVAMGGGKSYIAGSGLREQIEAARAKGEKFRIVLICDKHMLVKWKRELREAIPGIKVSIIESLADIDPNKSRIRGAMPQKKGRMSEKTHRAMVRRWENPHPLDAEAYLMAYTDISLSSTKQVAANVAVFRRENDEGKIEAVRMDDKIDPKTGKLKLHMAVRCPQCGAVQWVADRRGGNALQTLGNLDKKFQRCQAPITYLKADPTGTVVRVFDGRDESGNLTRVVRTYAVVLKKDKRGNEMKCNSPLWSHVANEPSYRIDTAGWTPKQRKLHGQHISEYQPRGSERSAGFGMPSKYVLEDSVGKLTIQRSGTRKIDMATYLRRYWRMPATHDAQGHIQPGRRISIQAVVIDEVHKAKSSGSARGMASANIASLATHSMLGLTGTITGGYSSTMFYLLWRFTPLIRKYFGYHDESAFVERYGARSFTTRSNDDRDLDDGGGRNSRRKLMPTIKEISGMSPEAYLLFWPFTVFAELPEIFPKLPVYRDVVRRVALDNQYTSHVRFPVFDKEGFQRCDDETGEPIFIEGDYTQQTAYQLIRDELEGTCRHLLARGDRGLLAATLQTMLYQPNLPGAHIHVVHPRRKSMVVCDFPGLREDILYPKERAVLEQVVRDKREGHKSILFISHTGKHDVLRRWEWVMEQARVQYGVDLNVAVMRAEYVDAVDREEWIADRVEGDEDNPPCDVLMCNPKLVETGLDMVDFSRTHFVELDYSIFTVLQAARRTYRPQQTKDVKVYYWVYAGTAEDAALLLVANKRKELAKVSGSSLAESLIQQAGPMNLQEIMAKQLAGKLIIDGQDAQATFDQAQTIEEQARARLIAETEELIDSSLPVLPDLVLDPDAAEEPDPLAALDVLTPEFFAQLDMMTPEFFASLEAAQSSATPPPATTISTEKKRPPTWDELRALRDAKKRRRNAA